MEIKIFNKCNNKCDPCTGEGEDISTKEAIEIISSLKKEELIISGGEVLFREDIFQLLDLATNLRIKNAWIKTNGRLFANENLAIEFANYSVGAIINFSHFKQAEFEKKTKVAGSFDETIQGIKNLLKKGVRVKVTYSGPINGSFDFFKKLRIKEISYNILEKLEVVFPQIKKMWENRGSIKITFENYRRELSILLNHMFIGPIVAQFEITNKCNHQCVFCYHHSPHLLDKDDPYFKTHKYDKELVKRDVSWHNQKLDFTLFKKYVNEAASEGCTYIQLGGGGEPPTHPDLMNMLKYIKRKGLAVQVFTNFTLHSKFELKELVKLGVDVLEINISATDAKTYKKIHIIPHFEKVVENLLYIKKIKDKYKKNKPQIRIMNPICSINYNQIDKMVDFAQEYGASAVYLGHLQTTPLTNYLLLTPQMVKKTNELVNKAIKKVKIENNFSHYLEVLNQKGTLEGSHTKEIFNKVGCLMPFYETQVHLDNSIAPCCLHPTIFNASGMSFKEMWNNEEYKKFRKKVLDLYKNKEKEFLCRGCRMCVYQADIQRFYKQLGPLSKYLGK